MKKSPKKENNTFGELSLIDESTYYAEVPWNRGIKIRLIVHVDGKNHNMYIESARRTFSAIRKKEMMLFRQGIDVVNGSEFEDAFLYNTAETSIEIFSNGKGQLVYLVWMVGSLIVEFSGDAGFENARVMPG